MKVLSCLHIVALGLPFALAVAADIDGAPVGAVHRAARRVRSHWSRRHNADNERRSPFLGVDLDGPDTTTSSSSSSEDPSLITLVIVGPPTSVLPGIEETPTSTVTLTITDTPPPPPPPPPSSDTTSTETTPTETPSSSSQETSSPPATTEDPATTSVVIIPIPDVLDTSTEVTHSVEVTSETPLPEPTTTTDPGILLPILTSDILGGLTSDLPLTDLPLTDLPLTSDLPITLTDIPIIPTDVPSDPPVTDPPITTPPSDDPITTTKTTAPFDPDPTGIFPNTTVSIPDDPITTTDDVTSHIVIPTEYGYLTATTFVIGATSNDTAATFTGTDPDAPLSSGTLAADHSAGTTITLPDVPVSVPMFISPSPDSNPVSAEVVMPGYSQISILFQSTVAWTYVLQHADTAGQILAYLPQMIANALNIPIDQVKTIGLQAFIPDDYSSETDLKTLWRGLIPEDQVATLAAMIKANNSAFYQQADPVAKAIANNVLMSYNIASVNGVSNANGSHTPDAANSNQSSVSNARRNAIIGVCASLGAVALGVFLWWFYKTRKQKKEAAHQRISYATAPNYGATAAGGGMSEAGSGVLHNPFLTEREREDERNGIVRRNSFYAVGPDDQSIEEETFDYMSQHSGGLQRNISGGSGGRWAGANTAAQPAFGRRPVMGQPISQPILRESSMGNW